MLSEVDIANMAITALGGEPLDSFDDPTEPARLVRAVFVPSLLAVLREHPWNCAIRRKQIGQLAPPILPGVQNQIGPCYQLPADCIRVLGLEGEEPAQYEVEGRSICAAEETAVLRYVARIGAGELDPAVAHALAMRIAAQIGHSMTGSSSAAEAAQAQYRDALAAAKLTDSAEFGPRIYEPETNWLSVRVGGRFF